MAQSLMPVFVARHLTKTYQRGEVTASALYGVDLEIYEGEFVVLLGPSGSGKSTLLNILGGLDTATSGEVRWRDQDLVRASEQELTRYRRQHVGFVFQFYNLTPSLIVRENVALVTDLVEQPMAPEDALRLVGLDHRLDHFPSQLSGGTHNHHTFFCHSVISLLLGEKIILPHAARVMPQPPCFCEHVSVPNLNHRGHAFAELRREEGTNRKRENLLHANRQISLASSCDSHGATLAYRLHLLSNTTTQKEVQYEIVNPVAANARTGVSPKAHGSSL
jgi:ABC transporter